jgi:endonuclease/exonuclease/phosphatase family metal-dependent hydrolase
MKLLTYNIQFGLGKDGRIDLERIAHELDGADIICLQEVDRHWPRSDNIDQVAEFFRLFPDYHAEYGPGVNLGCDSRNKQGQIIHRRQQFGNLTLSRMPIAYSRHHLLSKYASLGPISLQRSALECVIKFNHTELRVVNTHLTHLSSETREPQIQQLLDIHRNAILEGSPLCGTLESDYWKMNEPLVAPPRLSILAGDLNLEPDSNNYTQLAGPVSDYGGRMVNPDLFIDARSAAGYDEADGSTSDIRGRPARLDYIFLSTELSDDVKDCWIDSEAQGSDHQPLWLELNID